MIGASAILDAGAILCGRRWARASARCARFGLPPALLLLGALVLAGCTPVGAVVGAASTVGVAAVQERSLSDAATDTRIRLRLNDIFLSRDLALFSAVDFAVVERRVLLVGNVAREEDRDYAAREVWNIDGVEVLINELEIGPGPGLQQIADDRWTGVRLKAALLGDGDVIDVNYWILVNDGTIYLLGVAQSDAELERVMAHARGIPNVQRVVSHVVLKSDPSRASPAE